MYNKIALDWRLRGERYRLEGLSCPHCGTVHFPSKAICSECGHPMNGLAEIAEVESVEREGDSSPAPFLRQEKREMALAEA